jgi:hypothetical protein
MDDRRIAKIVFGRHVLFGGFPASEMIALLKELPENTNIIGFGEEIHKACVCIGVEHPSFKKVAISECMPEIEASFVKTEEGTKVTVNLSSVLEKPDYTGPVKFDTTPWKSNWLELAKLNNLIVKKDGELKPRKSYQLSPTAFADAAKALDDKLGNSLYINPKELTKYINEATERGYNDIQNRIYGSFTFPTKDNIAVELGNGNLTTMSNYDDDNEYPLWFSDEEYQRLLNTPTTPANQIYDPAELTRALDEGYNWAVKNHADNFKAEHEHKWKRYVGSFKQFDYCCLEGCQYNRDDDGRIWKS